MNVHSTATKVDEHSRKKYNENGSSKMNLKEDCSKTINEMN